MPCRKYGHRRVRAKTPLASGHKPILMPAVSFHRARRAGNTDSYCTIDGMLEARDCHEAELMPRVNIGYIPTLTTLNSLRR